MICLVSPSTELLLKLGGIYTKEKLDFPVNSRIS